MCFTIQGVLSRTVDMNNHTRHNTRILYKIRSMFKDILTYQHLCNKAFVLNKLKKNLYFLHGFLNSDLPLFEYL